LHGASEVNIGEKIKRLRQERNWSEAQLANRLDIHQKQISGYERNIHVPSTEVIIKIAITNDPDICASEFVDTVR